MSPTKTTIIKNGFKHTKESLSGGTFPLQPQEVMDLLDTTKSTLFRHETELGIVPRREIGFNGDRQYSDNELELIAKATKGASVISNNFGTTITGRTGNTAFIPKK